MIVLFASALLFVFLAYVFGAYLCGLLQKFFRIADEGLHHFQYFLLGFILLGTYFNVWSLVVKVDFLSIIPLVLISIFLLRNNVIKLHFQQLKQALFSLGRKDMIFVFLPIAVLVILFAIIPPQHGDSGSYHFMSIRWIEEFKLVPGLANLHGRFGFNSTFFVTSAAFSFSDLFEQAIYPVNVAVAFVFYLWLINKVRINRQNLWSIVYVFAAIILFRSLLIAVSSPSPDLVSSVIVMYVFIDAAEKIISRRTFSQLHVIKQLMLMAFAVTIKLSAVGLLPLAILLLVQIRWSKKFVLLLSVSALIIVCPWLIRNYILTGYLIYPLEFTAISNEWKVPFVILNFDRLLINNGPKLISSNWQLVDKMRFIDWFPLWLKHHAATGLTVTLVILITSVTCLFFGIFKSMSSRHFKVFWLFACILGGILFWITNSPDYRFGYAYIIAGIVAVALYASHEKHQAKFLFPIVIFVLVASAIFYASSAFRHLEGYSIEKYWIKPMPSSVFTLPHKLSTYNYRMLNRDIKLYIEDSTHNWNLAPLPAYMDFAPEISAEDIEMRGNKIEDGFRIKRKL